MKNTRFIICIFSVISCYNVVYASDSSECMHNIKAIIFDFDGVLIDNGIAYFLDWHAALGQQGYELPAKQFWSFMDEHELVGMPGADTMIVKFCCALLGRDCERELLEVKKTFSRAFSAKGFPPIESTVQFLKKLVQDKEHYGYKLGLASGNSHKHLSANLSRLGIEKCFDVIVSGSDDLSEYADPEGVNKPKPYIYLYAAKRLGLDPAECVAIEDSKVGVSAAVHAGYKVVAIPNEYTAPQNLSLAHLRIESFDGIGPADFLSMIAEVSTPHAEAH